MSIKDRCGNAIVECAIAMPMFIVLLLMVIHMTILSTTKLLGCYATYMAARAASVQRPEDRKDVASKQGMVVLKNVAEAEMRDGQLLLRHIERPIARGGSLFRKYEVRTAVPLIVFPRRASGEAPKGDNPLP